jgi:hypothetical protein
MAIESRSKIKVLERGDLFYLYRPSVEAFAPGGLVDVRRFYMVLQPEATERFRLIAIGKKKLPGGDHEVQRHWGFVDGVFSTSDELLKAAAGLPGSMEVTAETPLPAGEGVYALILHGNHTHLAYVMELPSSPGEVQQAFNIHPEGRFVIAVKNPSAASPPGVGLDFDRQADFPDDLKVRFGDRRWMSIDPPAFLDHEGAEIVLIGGQDDLGEDLGIDLQAHPTYEETADIFRALHVERSERTIKPLVRGTWL